MNQWDKAARQAAIEVCAEANLPMNDKFVELVRDEFADLRATYDAMKSYILLDIQGEMAGIDIVCEKLQGKGGITALATLNDLAARKVKILAIPLVQSAIERSKE